MYALNLPHYTFTIQTIRGKRMILDPVRQKYVLLTPEEWVRQHFVQYLIQEKGVPPALMAIERGFTYQGMLRRADIIVHDRKAAPLLMVECKAPTVPVNQNPFDQIARYNRTIRARYLVVTNGLIHYTCALNHAAHTYQFLDDIPMYAALTL